MGLGRDKYCTSRPTQAPIRTIAAAKLEMLPFSHRMNLPAIQRLKSGLLVQQDFRVAARFAFFDTGFEGFRYGTHGGTIFISRYNFKYFAITCHHILQDYEWRQIIITDMKGGRRVAGIKSVSTPAAPRGHAVDTDLLDIAIIEFSDELTASFFDGGAYILDEKTISKSSTHDKLLIYGALKKNSEITEKSIKPIYCLISMTDGGAPSNDATIRHATGIVTNSAIDDLSGLSGSPVFNVTKNALCGIVVRGGISDKSGIIWYVDIIDIMYFINAVFQNQKEVSYYRMGKKATLLPITPPSPPATP